MDTGHQEVKESGRRKRVTDDACARVAAAPFMAACPGALQGAGHAGRRDLPGRAGRAETLGGQCESVGRGCSGESLCEMPLESPAEDR